MRQTRRYFSQAQKQEMLERDGPLCFFRCGHRAQDADHAIRLSSALPNINETWNGNLLCRECHEAVTNPNSAVKWKKALAVIQAALHRAYDLFPEETYRKYYNYYKSKAARYKQLYE